MFHFPFFPCHLLPLLCSLMSFLSPVLCPPPLLTFPVLGLVPPLVPHASLRSALPLFHPSPWVLGSLLFLFLLQTNANPPLGLHSHQKHLPLSFIWPDLPHIHLSHDSKALKNNAGELNLQCPVLSHEVCSNFPAVFLHPTQFGYSAN